MKVKSILMILAVCFICGCDSDKDSSEQPACTGSETRCTTDGKIETCSSGEWGAAKDCPQNQVCRGKACIAESNDCTDNETRCTTDGKIETCSSGQWGAAQDCPQNQVCRRKACIAESNHCTDNETRCTTGGKIETCSNGEWGTAKDCPENQICQGTNCISIDTSCTVGASQCSNKQIQYCENGRWGTAKDCPINQECRENSCVQAVTTSEKQTLTCGTTVCNEGQMCQNGTCIDRNVIPYQTEDFCTPSSFMEFCDGNTLVYCKATPGSNDAQIIAEPCEEGTQCVLRFDKNFGYCAKADVNCNANTAGAFPICNGDNNLYYIEMQLCALAADGYYYVFRDELVTKDCLGTCIDKYSCDLKDQERICTVEGSHCEGNISVTCAPDSSTNHLQSTSTNCDDYNAYCPGIQCLPETGECDWNACE